MPMLHRHIGATGHAWADDNGKIVMRTNVPSHQRLMRFTVEWHGDIDLTPMFQPGRLLEDEEPENFNSVIFPAASFNANMERRHVYDEAYYNWCGYANLHMIMGETTDRDAGGTALRTWTSTKFCGGIVWDAASWHWAFRFSFQPWLKVGGYTYPIFNILFDGDAEHSTAYALYESAPSVQDIRVGSGINMTLQGLYGNYEDGAADCLAGTSLTLSAQYDT